VRTMADIPPDPKRIRARIRSYERKLEQERRELGSYHDGAGKRYFLGPLYLLAGDLAGAVRSFRWFEQEFPDDGGDPGQSLCWAAFGPWRWDRPWVPTWMYNRGRVTHTGDCSITRRVGEQLSTHEFRVRVTPIQSIVSFLRSCLLPLLASNTHTRNLRLVDQRRRETHSCQSRCFGPEHDSNVAQRHHGDELTEALSLRGGTPGDTEVLIDDIDLGGPPAEVTCAMRELVLPVGGFSVVVYLRCR